ncbi:MAG: dihydrofolate reductase family protein [Nakamurella sp.]
MSRTVNAHLFASINGIVEDPNLWQFDAFGAEEGAFMGSSLAEVTDVVMGAELWRQWSGFWADNNDDFGAFINPVRKHVIGTSLADQAADGGLGWNSTLVTGDPIEYVTALKDNGEAGRIAVVGGITTTRSLFVGGVIDALTLTVHPVAAGAGRRLFDESVPTTRLRLLDSQITSTGNAMLTYGLRPTD